MPDSDKYISLANLTTFADDIKGKAQPKITQGSAISSVSDSTNFSSVNLTNKTTSNITGSAVRDYIQSKIVVDSSLESSTSSGTKTIKMPNKITAQSTQAFYPVKLDAQGRVTAYGTGHSATSEYKSAANNQLFNRNGAAALWNGCTHLVGIFTRTSGQSISLNSWANVSLTGSNDVDTTYCSLSGNGIKFAKAGIYEFTITVRLADSVSSGTLCHWCIGTSSHEDDQNGGEWATTVYRHKATTVLHNYYAANATAYPRVYVNQAAGGLTINYCNVVVKAVKV